MIISFLRAILLYAVIIIAIRLMGKRQISELQTSELVITLLLSDIAVVPMQDPGIPLMNGLVPMTALVACELILSVGMLKNGKFRRIICGKPVLIINNGKINQDELRRLRITSEELSQQLRQIEIFSIQDVAYAIVETNGKISAIRKPDKQQADASMVGAHVPDTGIEAVVISDGQFSDFALDLCGLSREFIHGVLKGKNLNVSDVFIMTSNKNKEFNIIRKEGAK